MPGSESPVIDVRPPIVAAPVTPALSPRIPAPRTPADEPPADNRIPGDERLLPRRVRQANLVPQLRGPVAERAESTTVRTPEKVRSLMSALQRGTTQGRKDAAALAGKSQPEAGAPASPRDQVNAGGEGIAGEGDAQPPVTDKEQTPGQPAWSEAATVTFPAVGTSAAGADGGTDGAPEENNSNHAPVKDA